MVQKEVKIELGERYCPTCKFDTQHAVRMVVRAGYPRPEEISSACGVCNGDAFWALRMAAEEAGVRPAGAPVKVLPGVT